MHADTCEESRARLRGMSVVLYKSQNPPGIPHFPGAYPSTSCLDGGGLAFGAAAGAAVAGAGAAVGPSSRGAGPGAGSTDARSA